MYKLSFKTINAQDLLSSRPYHGKVQIPKVCPHCGVTSIPTIVDKHAFTKETPPKGYLVLYLQCPSCYKFFLSTTTLSTDDNDNAFCSLYPMPHSLYQNDLIKALSPDFMDLYNQALAAEDNDHYRLAAIGLRTALEVLIKDYAINHLHRNPEDVSQKSLCNAITEYLPSYEAGLVADVVRILGNDNVHYISKHTDCNYDDLKDYMGLFLTIITNTLKAANPPVSRQQKNQS